MPKVKVNVQMIAELANVSPGTVSNALNDRPGVSIDTKQKIIEIADQLGYVKKNTSSSTARGIRIIMYKRTGHILSDTPFFSNLIEGMQKECRAANYEMLISHITKGPDSEGQIQELKQENVDNLVGFLILATEMLEEDFDLFEGIEKPIVFMDSYFPRKQSNFVLINNFDGAYQATQHLIDNGHKNIGYLASSIPINNFYHRKQGFVSALQDNQLPVDEKYWFSVKPTLDGAYHDTISHLTNNNQPLPTAFFADNDIIAFGALSAFKERGIDIPRDVSIIGFDDMPYCEIAEPKMSTVHVNKQQFGAVAVKRLIDIIENNDSVKQKIEINTDLVIRNSVSNIK